MNSRRISTCILLAVCLVTGCGQSGDKETVRGLQEENRVFAARIAELEDQVRTLREENKAAKSLMKKEFEEHLTKVQQLQREKTAQLEGTIAELRLELGTVQREKLLLQETLDQGPRVQEAIGVRFSIERAIWILFLVVAVSLVLLLASKYFSLRSQLYSYIVRNVAGARNTGGRP